MLFTLITVDGHKRPLRSRKRRQRRKSYKQYLSRWWRFLPQAEKNVRLDWLAQEIFKPKCPACNEGLGENWRCQTCVDSWPELTEDEKRHLDEMGERLKAKLFGEGESTPQSLLSSPYAATANSATSGDCTLESLTKLMAELKPIPKRVVLIHQSRHRELKATCETVPQTLPIDQINGLPFVVFNTWAEMVNLKEEYERDGYEVIVLN